MTTRYTPKIDEIEAEQVKARHPTDSHGRRRLETPATLNGFTPPTIEPNDSLAVDLPKQPETGNAIAAEIALDASALLPLAAVVEETHDTSRRARRTLSTRVVIEGKLGQSHDAHEAAAHAARDPIRQHPLIPSGPGVEARCPRNTIEINRAETRVQPGNEFPETTDETPTIQSTRAKTRARNAGLAPDQILDALHLPSTRARGPRTSNETDGRTIDDEAGLALPVDQDRRVAPALLEINAGISLWIGPVNRRTAINHEIAPLCAERAVARCRLERATGIAPVR